jgi:ferrous iron transport protein B
MTSETVSDRILILALVGNPNCGKTALFNALTGSRQRVANFPGVTVERKVGILKMPAGAAIEVIDLPGSQSLRARSTDEAITRDVVLGWARHEKPPDVILCVSDATNLNLHLRLVLELKKIGRPLVLALNMMDIVERSGLQIDLQALSRLLGIPVVPTVAVRRDGIRSLLAQLDAVLKEPHRAQAAAGTWSEPSAADIRAYHQEVERILGTVIQQQGQPDRLTERLDKIVLNPWLGLPILVFVLFLVFQAVFSWATPVMDAIDAAFTGLKAVINQQLPEGPLRSLLADGAVAGVGSVLVFVPQILILFAFILLLEDFGYTARAAFLMDRLMGGVGLNGRAFIPLLSSFACAVPGIMATRTIASPRDRLTTTLIAPLMTCSARIPVYTLLIAAFIPAKAVWIFNLRGLVMFSLYATGIISALLMSLILRLTVTRGHQQPLLMEMPTYKVPNLKNVAIGLYERAKIFVRRAGTLILCLMIILWFLATFPAPPADATQPSIYYSLAGQLGQLLEPLLAPLGFNWQIAIALIPGMAAREVAVAALGTIYALSGSEDAVNAALTATLAQSWTLPMALALLAWYVFAPQCAATLAVTKRETNSWKWPIFMFAYLMTLAYLAAFVTYHVASWLGG